MRSSTIRRRATRAACACLACALAPAPALTTSAADDPPSRLGRLFRFGAAGETSKPAPITPAGPGVMGSQGSSATGLGSSSPIGAPTGRANAFSPGQPALSTPPSGPTGATAAPRISPKPRVNKAITEADPLVTRIAIGRADGGSQFGMFLQVFADGTVIDGGGVHKISPELLKPVVEAVNSGDFGRVKGHCGGPAGDTFENIHVVAYERSYGKLRANAFSYSGNPQGCDHSVHHLHKVLEDLQLKLDNPGMTTTAAAATPVVVSPAVASPPLGPMPANDAAPAGPLPPMSAPTATPTAHAAPLGMPSLPDPGLH